MKNKMINLFDADKWRMLPEELDLDRYSISSLILVVVGFILLILTLNNIDSISNIELILGSAAAIVSAMLAAVIYFAKLRKERRELG
ncbi:MAG: hypothetical protein ACPGWR_20580 [Ardenticatenaceae bacterium]